MVKHTVRGSRWWFTLMADEKVICKIESNWTNIRPDLNWTLLRSLRSCLHVNLNSMDAKPAVSEVKVSQAVCHSRTVYPSPSYPADVRQSLYPQPLSPGISVRPQVTPECSASKPSPWDSATASQSLSQSSSNAVNLKFQSLSTPLHYLF